MESILWPLQRKQILVREKYWIGFGGALVRGGRRAVNWSIGFTWEAFLEKYKQPAARPVELWEVGKRSRLLFPLGPFPLCPTSHFSLVFPPRWL